MISAPAPTVAAPAVTVRRASEFALAQLAAHQSRCFEGYTLPVIADVRALADRVRSEHIDLQDSFELYDHHGLVAQTLVAHRGDRSRIASMGVPPEARGRGWGRQAIEQAVEDARRRGDTTLQLEVLTANVAAVRLYESTGFTRARELVGFELDAIRLPRPESTAAVRRIPVHTAAEVVIRHGGDLPWQLQGATLLGLGSAWQAWTNGPSVAVVKAQQDVLVCQTLITDPEHCGRGHARDLLSAVHVRCAPRATRLRILSLVPAGTADGFAGRIGARRAPLSQWEMRLPLWGAARRAVPGAR